MLLRNNLSRQQLGMYVDIYKYKHIYIMWDQNQHKYLTTICEFIYLTHIDICRSLTVYLV